MAEYVFIVTREHGTDPFYEVDDTRKLDAIDAAHLVRNGVLEPADDDAKKAMADILDAEPVERSYGLIQRVDPDSMTKEEKAKAASDAKAKKKNEQRAAQIAADDAKAKAAGLQGKGTERASDAGQTGGEGGDAGQTGGEGGEGGGEGGAGGDGGQTGGEGAASGEGGQTGTPSANANPNASTGRRR